VRGLVKANQAGTLYLEESEDNSTWTTTTTVSVSANVTTELPWTALTKQYFRFRYVNGAMAQTSFSLIQQVAGLQVERVEVTGSTVLYTTPTHTEINVTTTSGQVLASNAARKYAIFINNSDTVIYIKLGAAANVNQGIRLNAYGGSYEMSAMLGNLYTGAINAIHAGNGNKTLLVTEGV
jgi:hypothetical protein